MNDSSKLFNIIMKSISELGDTPTCVSSKFDFDEKTASVTVSTIIYFII